MRRTYTLFCQLSLVRFRNLGSLRDSTRWSCYLVSLLTIAHTPKLTMIAIPSTWSIPGPSPTSKDWTRTVNGICGDQPYSRATKPT